MDTVSDIFAFVLNHGVVAEEVVFHDGDEPLPGLTEDEAQAISDIEPHLEKSWIALLSACREALWALADGHPSTPSVRHRKQQKGKMFEWDEVRIPLHTGHKAHCGFALTAWGADQYHLYIWVWVHRDHLKIAEEAVADLGLDIWRNEHGSFLMTLPTPQQGERIDALAASAADHLWSFARPISDAVHNHIEANS